MEFPSIDNKKHEDTVLCILMSTFELKFTNNMLFNLYFSQAETVAPWTRAALSKYEQIKFVSLSHFFALFSLAFTEIWSGGIGFL